jgi:hypothetical protein
MLLKGNYEVEKNLEPKEVKDESFREKALASIGGSMVFVERKKLYYDPIPKTPE